VAKVHFQNLYREDGSFDSDLTSEFLSNIPYMVSEEENDELMNPFWSRKLFMLIGQWSWIKPQDLMVSPFIFIEFAGQ